MDNKRNYKDLSDEALHIFNKLGYFKNKRGTKKPYYVGVYDGKVYRVYGNNKLKPLKDNATPKQYGRVKLKFKDKFKTIKVHRLVGDFIPNPDNLPVINHKNNLRNNNSIDNLEWCTQKQNINHYWNEIRKKEEI